MRDFTVGDEPRDIVLDYLRRIDRKVDGLLEDFRLFNVRVVAGESQVAGLHVGDVQQNAEIDRIKTRLDRIERRLQLAD
jgi:hypothetical protein